MISKANEHVLVVLNKLVTDGKDSVTTQMVADKLGLSRSVTSHYLTTLLADNRVTKIEGRPVRWTLSKADTESTGAFSEYIGAKGSQVKNIIQCEAAVRYPNGGLNILITGESGVGKSYLAKNIVKFAKKTQVIAQRAPFIVLNCADYANNPELLSSVLFGYTRGAFTGATNERQGLLKEADGGFLFLDEVHRLSGENQEKLFSFMDTGQFRPLGENVKTVSSRVRFIFATTEDPNKILLTTFTRRVPVSIQLSAFHERPLNERLAIVKSLFIAEARRSERRLEIDPQVLAKLVMFHSPGNIGKLKNIIKVACARAFNEQYQKSNIIISINHLSNIATTQQKQLHFETATVINPDTELLLTTSTHDVLNYLIKSLINGDSLQVLINQLHAFYQQHHRQLIQLKQQEILLYNEYYYRFNQIIRQQFGIKIDDSLILVLFKSYLDLDIITDEVYQNIIKVVNQEIPRSWHIAQSFCKYLSSLTPQQQVSQQVLIAIVLSELVDEDIVLKGLMVAHGKATATSIQSVVNQLAGNYIFDAIDMPIDTSIEKIIAVTNKLVKATDTTNGFILLVDMGSLNQLYTAIKNNLTGELLVINNLTTAIALDVGLKMQQGLQFKQIAKAAQTDYEIKSRYYAGFSQNSNIIISCMSGLGISKKIKELMLPFLPKSLSVITLDYALLQKNIRENDSEYFKETLFVMTTTNLTTDFAIPNMNIYDILDKNGRKSFWQLFKHKIDEETFQALNTELLRFFSIEGVGERLSFLNPKVVIKEVETVIYKYENFYQLNLDGKVKLNLYMHIALMIERLMISTRTGDHPNAQVKQTKEIQEFFSVSRGIFQPVSLKYNISVNDYELSLLYELFSYLF